MDLGELALGELPAAGVFAAGVDAFSSLVALGLSATELVLFAFDAGWARAKSAASLNCAIVSSNRSVWSGVCSVGSGP